LAGLFTGCEYQPHELPVNDIDQPPADGPPIVMSLNDMNDTIRIGWKTEFHYDITGTDKRINYVNIAFEGEIIHNYVIDNQQTFTFTLDPAEYSNGNYHLNISIFTSTGSGSIADKVGAEVYIYELDWPVYVDKTLPEYSNSYLVAARSEAGIDLTWTSFDHPNFISYIVYRYYPFFQSEPVAVATITDPLQNSFTDSTFCEGQIIRYFVRTVTPAGYSEGQDIVFSDQLHGLRATWNSNGTADVTWDKARNPESFGKYYIYSGYRSSDFIEEQFIEDPDQNHARLLNAGFGSGLYIFLKFIPKGVPSELYRNLSGINITLYPQAMLPQFYFAYNLNEHDFMLLIDFDKIYRYFPGEVLVEDFISVNLEQYWHVSVSGDGNLFAYYQNEEFFIRSTEDFSIVSQFQGPPLKSLNRTLARCFVSDNGRLLAVDSEGNGYFYNTTDGTLIREDPLNIGGYPAKLAGISPDGTKMIILSASGETILYNFTPGGWTEIGRTDIQPFEYLFSKDSKAVYIIGLTTLEKRDAGSFSLITQFSLPGGYFRSTDPDHGRIFCASDREFEYKILDLETGNLLRTLTLGSGWCWLYDNLLITSGLQLTLPEFE